MRDIRSAIEGDYVLYKNTGEVGVVVRPFGHDQYVIMTRGLTHIVEPPDVEVLDAKQAGVINAALLQTARVIDAYRDEETYDPVYSEEGEIQYSASAAAVLRNLGYPALIVSLSKAGDRIRELEEQIANEHGA